MIKRQVERFTLSSQIVGGSRELRLDASFYNPRVAEALRALRESDMAVKALGDIAERVYIPPRFKRIYVDREHGVPFLQGSHIIQFRPADLKYVSTAAHKKLAEWIVRAGWILVTRSGTVGRVAMAPQEWDGWAVSEHVLRIVPRADPDCPPGYLASFLSSPIGQAQLTAQIYGAVVDELTEEQARSVQVPVARTSAQRERVKAISNLTTRAVQRWADAMNLATEAEIAVAALTPGPPGREVMGRDDRVKIDMDPEEALSVLIRTPPQRHPAG